MYVEVIGKRYVKGVGKSGRPYEGFLTSVAYEVSGYDGLKCEEKFLSCEALKGLVPNVGDCLDINVNFGGYIESVSRYERKK